MKWLVSYGFAVAMGLFGLWLLPDASAEEICSGGLDYIVGKSFSTVDAPTCTKGVQVQIGPTVEVGNQAEPGVKRLALDIVPPVSISTGASFQVGIPRKRVT